MIQTGLEKLCWGFLFIMVSIRIQGFDILPDIVGYLLFASGFRHLSPHSGYFKKASIFNIIMIFLSLFSIYQFQVQGGGIQIGPLGILLSIVYFILNLLVIYNLFNGIREIEESQDQPELAFEADRKWNSYLLLQLANAVAFFLVFIPAIAFIYILIMLVVNIAILIGIMGYIRKCRDSIKNI